MGKKCGSAIYLSLYLSALRPKGPDRQKKTWQLCMSNQKSCAQKPQVLQSECVFTDSQQSGEIYFVSFRDTKLYLAVVQHESPNPAA